MARSEFRPRTPIVARLWLFVFEHLGLVLGLSFVGWLLALALLALLLLPGCAAPAPNTGELLEATTSIERDLGQLEAGRIDAGAAARRIRDELDNIRNVATAPPQGSSGFDWLDAILAAFLPAGAVGTGLHVYRNATRAKALAEKAGAP